jgi:hypothetical protein
VPKAFEAVTVEDYDGRVKAFFNEADNPGLKRPYRSCGYAPMVGLMRYLEANSFVTYIASGAIVTSCVPLRFGAESDAAP